MPGLLTLKTDLKSLKYGHDTPGGGDSGQPYIKTDIEKADTGFNRFRLTRFDDGLIRGGIIGTINASVVDTLRIGKFFVDFPKGPLFLAKQVGLQLTNPRIESANQPTNKATSGQGFLNNAINFVSNVANKIENAVGPTRIYNLGINTLAQVPVNAIGGHIVRHGFLPTNDESKYYFNVVRDNNFVNENNRLVRLSQTIIGNSDDIDTYIGGAGSVYGIGSTTIRRRSNYIWLNQDITANKFATTGSLTLSNMFAGYTRNTKNAHEVVNVDGRFLRASNYTTSPFSNFVSFTAKGTSISSDSNLLPRTLENFIADTSDPYNTPGIAGRNPDLPALDDINDLVFNGPSSYPDPNIGSAPFSLDLPNNTYGDYNGVKLAVDNLTSPNNLGIYATLIKGQSNAQDGRLPTSQKSSKSPTYTNGYGEVVTIKKPWNKATREIRIGSGRKDEINLTPLFTGDAHFAGDTSPGSSKKDNIRDLIRFRIQAVDTDNPNSGQWMVFRAYLTDLSDSVDATWNEVKYAGRGDKFWIYDSVSRKINISFKVAALSAEEMKPMYNKLNFLMSNLMPDYSGVLMRGPLVRISVGSWIDCQLGKLDSLSYKVPQDSPWEIALDKPEGGKQLLILPHVIEVTLSFTPIGSESRGKNELQSKERCISHIAQNNTGDVQLQYVDDCVAKKDPPPPPPPPLPKPNIPPATSDYLGAGAGFERAGGNTDAQRAFRE